MKAKIKQILAIILCSTVLVAAFPVPASAQIVNCGTRGEDGTNPDVLGNPGVQTQEGGCEWSHLFQIVYRIVNYMIGMAGFVAIFFIVWGGVQMLLSAGNMDRVKAGKTTIRNAILGLILVMLSYLIVSYVAGLIMPGVDDPLKFYETFLPKGN